MFTFLVKHTGAFAIQKSRTYASLSSFQVQAEA